MNIYTFHATSPQAEVSTHLHIPTSLTETKVYVCYMSSVDTWFLYYLPCEDVSASVVSGVTAGVDDTVIKDHKNFATA